MHVTPDVCDALAANESWALFYQVSEHLKLRAQLLTKKQSHCVAVVTTRQCRTFHLPFPSSTVTITIHFAAKPDTLPTPPPRRGGIKLLEERNVLESLSL